MLIPHKKAFWNPEIDKVEVSYIVENSPEYASFLIKPGRGEGVLCLRFVRKVFERQ